MTETELQDYKMAISTFRTRRDYVWMGRLQPSLDRLINGLEEREQRENTAANLFWRAFLLIPEGPDKEGLRAAAAFLRKIPEAG